MPEQPSNPEPAHPHVDSMLSRKFGKEIANYFSGSPLNRVGFLREDHIFLSNAFKHPSTSFLLCNDLQPLIKKGYKVGANLEFVGKDTVTPIVGDDPYAKTEKEQLADYDSGVYIPQMVFLGIDEAKNDGMEYQSKNLYKGAPYFAVDITPRQSVKEACEKLIAELGEKGYTFAQGRVMDVDATHGKSDPRGKDEV
jgi:NAD+ diphosphatase